MDMAKITELVKEARAMDEEARSELCRQTYDMGYYSALKLVKNPDDALDIVQEAYLKVFSNLDSLYRDESFVKWFHCIVMNLTKNYLKKKKPTLFAEMRDEESASSLNLEDGDITFQPDENWNNSETRRLVAGMVDNLPEDQRLCILMYYFNELSVSEISHTLEISENTVKSRLNYGRKKIKSQVLELENTQGVKLYGAAHTPVLVWVRWSALVGGITYISQDDEPRPVVEPVMQQEIAAPDEAEGLTFTYKCLKESRNKDGFCCFLWAETKFQDKMK